MNSQSLDEAIKAHFQRIEIEQTAVETAVGTSKTTAVPEQGLSLEDETMAGADSLATAPCAETQAAAPPKKAMDDAIPDVKQTSAYVWETTTHRYTLKDAFQTEDRYWIDDVRASRFKSTIDSGILYRPKIAADLHQMIESALSLSVANGVMVKGPGGIGKSHSLVNLVRKLLYSGKSNNKYLVTFIPDCFKWQSVVELLVAICKSCGISAEPFLVQVKGNDVADGLLLDGLINSIDGILCSMGKQWVFVFDQINKLFVKSVNIHAKDATGLAFPFHFIQSVMKPGRITAVVSASSNNEMAYKESSHEGFSEYFHNPAMTDQELLLWNDEITAANVHVVLNETWGVPLFTASFTEKKFDADAYEAEVIESVRHSLRKLKDETSYWDEIMESTISTLLYLYTREDRYDKMFLLPKKVQALKCRYEPLVPQVLTGYRSYVWADLMTYVAEKESMLLSVCADPATTNKVRGCHFETMVIRRCSSSSVDLLLGTDTFTVPSGDLGANGFGGQLLPEFPNDGLHFPYDPNFPAIDFFLKKIAMCLQFKCM